MKKKMLLSMMLWTMLLWCVGSANAESDVEKTLK